jgi:hypothetical protein
MEILGLVKPWNQQNMANWTLLCINSLYKHGVEESHFQDP